MKTRRVVAYILAIAMLAIAVGTPRLVAHERVSANCTAEAAACFPDIPGGAALVKAGGAANFTFKGQIFVNCEPIPLGPKNEFEYDTHRWGAGIDFKYSTSGESIGGILTELTPQVKKIGDNFFITGWSGNFSATMSVTENMYVTIVVSAKMKVTTRKGETTILRGDSAPVKILAKKGPLGGTTINVGMIAFSALKVDN